MEKKITAQEIFNIVWKACDTFRGLIDPSQYKDYILTMLFVKYVSDVWKDKYEKYKEEYKNKSNTEERINRALRHERFVVPKESTFDYLFEHRNEPNIGELINHALETLEENNRDKLSGEGSGIFRNIDFNSSNLGDVKDKNERLKNLLLDFSADKLDLRPSNLSGNDIIGDVYEYLISNFASTAGKKAGEFYTPSQISTLIAKLINAESGDIIYDPTCGSGSLLIKAAQEIGTQNFSIYGQESNGSTWALCIMNMFLHGIDDATIRWGDTIRNPKILKGDSLLYADKVVANPPFSLDKWGADFAVSDRFNRFWRGTPPKSKGDWAFISDMLEHAKDGKGKVGVVVPHGVLFRGSSEGKIRKRAIEDNHLEAVIGLPNNLFFGTGIPAAVLVFNKGKGNNTNVIFIDAGKEYEAGKNKNVLTEKHIERIVNNYKNFTQGKLKPGIVEEKYSYVAAFEEIKENEFNLNIPRYVDTFEEEDEINITSVQKEIEELETELNKVQKQMNGYLKELGF